MRNQLTLLERLRSPMTCHLQSGDPGKQRVSFQSSPEGLRTRNVKVVSPSPRAREDRCPNSPVSREKALPSSAFLPYAGPHVIGWCALYWAGQPFLFSLLIQMPISSRNTLTDTPKNNVKPNLCVLHNPVKLTHKINSHTSFFWGSHFTSLWDF